MNGDPGSTWPLTRQMILVVTLVGINALFAAAEMAFVSLNQTKINELSAIGNKKAKRVLDLLENSDDFLHTIHVVITLIGFLNSAFAAFHFTDYIVPLLGSIPGARTITMGLITLVLVYVTLVFGEMYPKEYALQLPEKTAMNLSGLILVVQYVLKPFIWLITASTELLKKITPVDFDSEKETMTRDEFRSYLEQSRQNEVIDIAEFSMLKGVLSLDNKIAREVMVPRTDTFMLDYDDGNDENIDRLLDVQYSRVPVYFEDKDNVLGIVHVKNLLKASKEKTLKEIDLKEIMNEPLFVPETIYIDDLLYELKRTRNQMAILNDEYGGVVGIVTLEDLLEEIVGDIDDEYDEIYQSIIPMEEKKFLVDGATPLDKFNDFFDTRLDSEDVDTIAGYFITEFGTIPQEEEDAFIQTEDLLLHVHKLDGSRISDLIVERLSKESLANE